MNRQRIDDRRAGALLRLAALLPAPRSTTIHNADIVGHRRLKSETTGKLKTDSTDNQ